MDPLILTVALDPVAFERLDGLRRAHFPPERNLIPAHVTLLHRLPGEEIATVLATLREAAARTAPFRITADGLRPLGRGVAITLESPALTALRADLALRFGPRLSAQDRQGFRPHVTIQNKVAPEQARALLARLQADFRPFAIRGEGLLLWHYRGGPWQRAAALPFPPAP
ncbi:2'-5' RNA ligase family protein [Marinivivus vitaminiproducens]|uniref:2'-5' RNA ligase family protein n=1 Tax=Marinivivus vitaminiproducens TaxID=3035935 RepID=UPI0027A2442A|nr:2'-5' RNA ligase family protein [Geminicoccaceae bacterium SCSIO 64248]